MTQPIAAKGEVEIDQIAVARVRIHGTDYLYLSNAARRYFAHHKLTPKRPEPQS